MRLFVPAVLLFSAGLAAAGAEPVSARVFETEVWPVIESTCLRCHGPEKQKGELRLDSREAMIKGGETGPAIVPGNPRESLLLRLVRHEEADRKMPPKEKLGQEPIAALERWIAEGASWPEQAAPIALAPAEILGDAWSDARNPIVKIFAGQRLDLWSFKPIGAPVPPPVPDSSWPRNPIDLFVLEKAAQLHPAPQADARTLCRRLYFDLTGLPPAPEEMEAFILAAALNRSAAIESLASTLLASPRYGEHWATMWLDVVRYSDSNGFDWDEFRPQAWRFRDYVARSLNADKPFDRFIREQLAGDELVADAPRDAAEQDSLIATGFLRLGPHDNSAALFAEGPRVRAALMNDLVETTGSAFLGLTLSCCRCHNHKFDPISQADYYRLRAFFEGVKFRDDLPLDLEAEQAAIRHHNEQTAALLLEKRKTRDAISTPAHERLRAGRLLKLNPDEQALLRAGGTDKETKAKIKALEKTITPSEQEIKAALSEEEKARYAAADLAIKTVKSQERPFTTGLVATDEKPPPTHVLFQGDLTKPREAVAPGFLSALDPNPAPVEKPPRPGSTGRRTALASWLVSGRNPLTARVIVNRIWQAHFGEGLVATPNDFGFAGTRPSNPALLDWLAGEFVKNGWSLKKLHLLIVTSAAYLQGAPEPGSSNGRLPRRLGAEAIRDSMLAVAGRLHWSEGGPPVWPAVPEEVLRANPAVLDDNAEKTKGWYPSPPEKLEVRTLFLVKKRGLRVPFMETFDSPESAVSCPGRNVSTVAPQALTLLNSPFAAEMAKAFAQRLEKESAEPALQIERAFALALQRPPVEEERAACLHFRDTHGLTALCRALLNLNEFIYID